MPSDIRSKNPRRVSLSAMPSFIIAQSTYKKAAELTSAWQNAASARWFAVSLLASAPLNLPNAARLALSSSSDGGRLRATQYPRSICFLVSSPASLQILNGDGGGVALEAIRAHRRQVETLEQCQCLGPALRRVEAPAPAVLGGDGRYQSVVPHLHRVRQPEAPFVQTAGNREQRVVDQLR